MGLYAVEKERALAAGDEKVNGFSGEIRSLENTGLEKGDVLQIPEKIEVFRKYFGKDKENHADYIFCTINGTENVKPFYPSTFVKRRQVYDEDGTPTGEFKYTKGKAADLYRTFAKVEDGMNALRGKKLVVTDIEPVRTLRFGTNTMMTSQIPVIDFVEE